MARSKLATMQPQDTAEEERVKRLGALGSVLDKMRNEAERAPLPKTIPYRPRDRAMGS